MQINIAIVDDERLFRQSLRFLLESQPDFRVIGEAYDGCDAVLLCKKMKPDIILMDVDMPRMDGIKATQIVSSHFPEIKILMLSILNDDQRINAALKAGAVGYIMKDADLEEFLEIIKSTYDGKEFISPFLANLAMEEQLTGKVAARSKEMDPEKAFIEKYSFTEREIAVLKMVSEGLCNLEVADKLFVCEETVKMHLKSIFRKLNVRNRTEAAVLAIKAGIRETEQKKKSLRGE